MKKALFLLLVILAPLFSRAQLIACRDSIKNGYDFWLYLPEDYESATKPKPIIMFLHGKSLSGHNLSMLKQYGCIDALLRGREIDAIVVAPQTSTSWVPEKVDEVYDWVKDHYVVDTNRFYVLGMSLGGYGTIDYTATYPEKVAAAMAMCGGATVTSVCGLNDVPLWIIHGTGDNAVSVSCSEKVVSDMASCGDTSRVIFDKIPKANHGALARVFYLEETYKWLLSHSLADSTRKVNMDYTMTDSLLHTAYANLNKDFKFKIIDSKPSTYTTTNSQYYIVIKGDCLSAIARKNHTTVSKICQLNGIKESATLSIGQKIKLK